MQIRRKTIIQNLFVIIGLAFLVGLIYNTGFDKLWTHLKSMGLWYIPIVLVWLVVYIINACCFGLIIHDESSRRKKLSFGYVLKITISGYAINYITPFGLLGGEPYKIMQLSKHIGMTRATSSVLLYAMMHFVSHFFFWLISVPLFVFLVPKLDLGLKITLALIFVSCSILIYLSFRLYKKGFILKFVSFATYIPFFGRKIAGRIAKNKENLMEMDRLFSDLYLNRKKDFFIALSTELLSRFVQCVEVLIMMYAIKVSFTFSESVLAESFVSLFANIFFVIPMQLGSREGGFIIIFKILGYSAHLGIFISLCTRIREMIWIFIGLLLINITGRKEKKMGSVSAPLDE